MTGAETALLLTVPAADPVVGPARARLDVASAVGVPAHVTVLYPFAPYASLTRDDLDHLGKAARSVPAFTLRFERTGWFGDDVVFLEPTPREPVLALIDAVVRAFPDFPPYGGAHDSLVPHLTVGHGHPVEQLRIAEAGVQRGLPVEQEVTALTLWSGPALLTGEAGWRQVAAFPLG